MRTLQKALGSLVSLSVVLVAGTAMADPIDYGLYELNNHPDGNAGAPGYGFRLDGLFDGNQDTTVTFDFEHEDSEMYMTYTEDGIHIYGTAVGGVDVGDTHADPQLYEIDFTYANNVTEHLDADGDEHVEVLPPAFQNFGSITQVDDPSQSWDLTDVHGSHDYTFSLGYDHRGEEGISGWGWVNHYEPGTDPTASVHMYSSDWLFTAEFVGAVPELGLGGAAAALFLLFGGGLVLADRRRQGVVLAA